MHTISTLRSFVYDTALLAAILMEIMAAQIPGDYILQGIAKHVQVLNMKLTPFHPSGA